MSGIFGVFSSKKNVNVFPTIYSGLFALQHRGQDAMGVSLLENDKLSEVKGKGLVTDNIKFDNINRLEGYVGLSHVRYPFSDDDKTLLPMPWVFYPGTEGEKALISIDGKFINKVEAEEISEVLNRSMDDIIEFISYLKGAYSILFAKEDKMIAIRDPYGIKPLVIGHKGCETIVSTESCAIEANGGQVDHFLQAGEIVVIDKNGYKSYFAKERAYCPCIFEMVYTARPDSIIDGVSVYDARLKMGEILYRENPVKADIVVGSPDSGLIAAIGFAKASGIEYENAIVRNKYIGRTFILPTDDMRKKDIKIKLNPIKNFLKGKDVVLVDDSIVRGNTIKRVIEILKDSGVNKIHIRIASPPVINSGSLTFDIPKEEELISHDRSIEEVRKLIGADSLGYISLEGLREACGNKNYYEKCFGGNDPFKE